MSVIDSEFRVGDILISEEQSRCLNKDHEYEVKIDNLGLYIDCALGAHRLVRHTTDRVYRGFRKKMVGPGLRIVGQDEEEWSCGHISGSVCRKCHEELIKKANELAADNERLVDRVDSLVREVDRLKTEVSEAKRDLADRVPTPGGW